MLDANNSQFKEKPYILVYRDKGIHDTAVTKIQPLSPMHHGTEEHYTIQCPGQVQHKYTPAGI